MSDTKKKYKLDLFSQLLPALDKRDLKFYSRLSDEEKKGFAGIVAMRYMSSIQSNDTAMQTYFVQIANEANKHFWNSEVNQHPELQYMLLCLCGLGKTVRHEWIKGLATKSKTNKLYTLLKEYYPTANHNELDMFISMNEMDDFIEIAQMLGYQKEQIADLKKEIRKVKK